MDSFILAMVPGNSDYSSTLTERIGLFIDMMEMLQSFPRMVHLHTEKDLGGLLKRQ